MNPRLRPTPTRLDANARGGDDPGPASACPPSLRWKGIPSVIAYPGTARHPLVECVEVVPAPALSAELALLAPRRASAMRGSDRG
jgi:hypothetical protein